MYKDNPTEVNLTKRTTKRRRNWIVKFWAKNLAKKEERTKNKVAGRLQDESSTNYL